MNYLISVVNPGAMDRVCEIAAAEELPKSRKKPPETKP